MITLTQRVLKEDGTLLNTLTHIFATTGTFKGKNNLPAGWHIQLGTYDSADNYTEYPDPANPHEVPDTMPDIIIPDEEPDPEADATEDDYQAALRDMGVDIPDEASDASDAQVEGGD